MVDFFETQTIFGDSGGGQSIFPLGGDPRSILWLNPIFYSEQRGMWGNETQNSLEIRFGFLPFGSARLF